MFFARWPLCTRGNGHQQHHVDNALQAAEAPSLRHRPVIEATREGGPGGYRYTIRRAYRRRVLALTCVLVSMLLLGCPPTSPVGPLGFQWAVKDQSYTTGWPYHTAGPPLCRRRHRAAELHPRPDDSGADLRSPRADAEGHADGGGHPPHDLYGERWQKAR